MALGGGGVQGWGGVQSHLSSISNKTLDLLPSNAVLHGSQE